MGDYAKNGNKIGTCGEAYYSTLEMLQKYNKIEPTCSETKYYLNPENRCSYAFPFPEYDGKTVGNISNFHKEDRKDFYFTFNLDETDETHHKDICQHLQPEGTNQGGINVFYPCPYHKDGKTSTNFNKSNQRFRLVSQRYHEGQLCIVGTCIYCGTSNIFSYDEALKIVDGLLKRAKDLLKPEIHFTKANKRLEVQANKHKLKESQYLHEIIRRILSTYEVDINSEVAAS